MQKMLLLLRLSFERSPKTRTEGALNRNVFWLKIGFLLIFAFHSSGKLHQQPLLLLRLSPSCKMYERVLRRNALKLPKAARLNDDGRLLYSDLNKDEHVVASKSLLWKMQRWPLQRPRCATNYN